MTKINSGRKTPGGKIIYFCECLMEWVPIYEAQLKSSGVIKNSIDIWQGSYNGGIKSGGTHLGGGAIDWAQCGPKAIEIARRLGAAAWFRPYNWDGKGGDAHGHLILVGCEHNLPGRYQVDAYKDGYNGLGWLGRKSFDGGPRVTIKSWKVAIAPYVPKPVIKDSTSSVPVITKSTAKLPKFDPNNVGKTVSLSIVTKAARTGGTHYHVTSIQWMLNSHALYKGKIDGQFGPQTKAAYKAWQQKLGFTGRDADGIPAKTSLTKLVTRFGYRIVG